MRTDLLKRAFASAHAHMRRTSRGPRTVGVLAVLMITMLILSGCPSKQLGFQGTLRDANGNPINGSFPFTFRLWTCGSGTGSGCSMVYEQGPVNVTVTNGLFDAPIGTTSINANEGPDPAIFTQKLYLEIEIEGEVLSPRQPLLGAPYAFTLVGGAVVISLHAGPGGSDGTDANYATFTVVAGGAKGTALAVNAATNGGDLIRACTGPIGGSNSRECDNLRFRVQNNGTVTADGTITGAGADFAEYISGVGARDQYEPGDVMVISATEDRAVELATEPYSTAVIGVYSTDPAFMGGGRYLDEDGNTDMLPVGIVGIVPVKVSTENGPIRRGDMLTTSSTPGHAMRATEFVPGSILGKAMGELEDGTGMVEVVLLLQ